MLHNYSPDFFDERRVDGISDGSNSVHPAGNPMKPSHHRGFSKPPRVHGSVFPIVMLSRFSRNPGVHESDL